MEVTKVVFDYVKPKDKGVCAEASITLNEEICIHGIKIVSGVKGLFITFPNHGVAKVVDGRTRFDDIVHPVNKDTRDKIEKSVLNEYMSSIE